MRMRADVIVRLDDRTGMPFGVHRFQLALPDTVAVFEDHSMNLKLMACSICPIRRVFSILLSDY